MAFRKSNRRSAQADTRPAQEFNLLAPDTGFEVIDCYIPTTGNNAAGVTEFRIIPSFDPETGAEDTPINPEAGPNDGFYDVFGPFMIEVEMMYKAGRGRSSFLTETWLTRAGVDMAGEDNWTAAHVFQKNMFNKMKEGIAELTAMGPHGDTKQVRTIHQTWVPWCGKWNNGELDGYFNSFCPQPSQRVLAQGMLSKVAGQPIVDPATGQPTWKQNCIIMLPIGASTKFLRDIRGGSMGDVVSSAGGQLLELQKYNAAKPNATYPKWEYTVARGSGVFPLDPNACKAIWRPWDSLLKPITVEDVLEQLAESFGWPAVAYGLRESVYEKLLSPEQRATAAGIPDLGATPLAPVYQQPQAPQGYAAQPPAPGYQQQHPPQQPVAGYPPQQPVAGYPPQQPVAGYPPQQPAAPVYHQPQQPPAMVATPQGGFPAPPQPVVPGQPAPAPTAPPVQPMAPPVGPPQTQVAPAPMPGAVGGYAPPPPAGAPPAAPPIAQLPAAPAPGPQINTPAPVAPAAPAVVAPPASSVPQMPPQIDMPEGVASPDDLARFGATLTGMQ